MKLKYYKFCISSLLAMLSALNAYGEISVSLSFSEADYHFQTNASGNTYIFSNDPSDYYSNQYGPCLPLTTKKIALPYSSEIDYYDFEIIDEKLIMEDITLSPAVRPTTSTKEIDFNPINSPFYDFASYPESSVKYTYSYHWQCIPIACFETTPFRYDVANRKLYFANKIKLTVHYKESNYVSKTTEDVSEIKEILKTWVVNTNDIDNIVSQIPAASADFFPEIEYILITTESQRKEFQRLVNWKRLRGISAELVTVEQIKGWYPGTTVQDKIKHCVYDLWYSYGCKFAVLGGDSIPSKGCYVTALDSITQETYTYNDAPVDKYYGCFNGHFDWNNNNNDLYGEIDDDVDFTQSVYVTRIPTRTKEDTNAFIDKLIAYESGSTGDNFSESMLTAGVKLRKYLGANNISDSEYSGNIFYQKYIQPYWDGKRVRFYDTGTDFPGNAGYNVWPENVAEQLSKNYMFISMTSHGGSYFWVIEPRRSGFKTSFTADQALSVESSASSIITTNACYTNAFDENKDPCLSEAFIRGDKNGVVAYLGCSREGWSAEYEYDLGPSLKYEGEFYHHLFSDGIKDKNYGKIVSYALDAVSDQCQENSSYRFVKMLLNPMGDSEMPIFTKKPKEFKTITYGFNPDSMDVTIYEHDSKISLISLNDFGKTRFDVFPNTTVASFENIPDFFVITITKQGFKPDLYGFKKNGNVIEYGPIVFNGTDVEFLETDVVYLNTRSSKIISRTNENNDDIEQVAVYEDTCKLILDNNDLYIKPPVFDECSKEMDLRIVNVMNNEILYEDNVASGSKTSISDLQSGFYVACLYSDNEMIDIIKFKK